MRELPAALSQLEGALLLALAGAGSGTSWQEEEASPLLLRKSPPDNFSVPFVLCFISGLGKLQPEIK